MRKLLFALIACAPCIAAAHHSPFIFFDPGTTVEAEGVVTGVNWRNPHVSFELTADGVSWEVEANAVSILRRMDLDSDSVQVGDTVTVAGWSPEDTECTSATWLASTADFAGDEAPEDIFHVWSTSLAGGPDAMLFEGVRFQLTESAQATRDAYDLYSNPILGTCTAKGMPTIMEQPYPMELVEGDGVIYLKMEEGDSVREIYMTGESPLNTPSPLGTSVGRWEGETLVVETTGSTWPYTDMTGVPNSEDSVMLEQFTPSDDGRRLNYTMTMSNPAILAEPVTFNKYWLWIPGASVEPYGCEVEPAN